MPQPKVMAPPLVLEIFGADFEEVRFARDSPLEGDGFELPVPGHGELCVVPFRRVPPIPR